MARIGPIPLDQMTPEQRRINDAIAGKRGGGPAKGPFGVWLRTPALAEKAAALGDYLRAELTIPPKLQELAILVVARHWTAQYEWHAHARHAAEVGIDPAIVEAIRTRREPKIAAYARAVMLLGEQAVVDLVTTIGFYVMVAVVLVGFRVDIPDGGAKPFS